MKLIDIWILQPSPSTTRPESSTPTSSLSYCMAPKHGELPSQTPTGCSLYRQMPQKQHQHQTARRHFQHRPDPIEVEIRKRKWGWIGHTLRKSPSNITKQALNWKSQVKWKVGRPKQTWHRSTDAEGRPSEWHGHSWGGPHRTECIGGVLLWPYVS